MLSFSPGISKIGDFAGIAGYIASKRLPLREPSAVLAIVVGGLLTLVAHGAGAWSVDSRRVD